MIDQIIIIYRLSRLYLFIQVHLLLHLCRIQPLVIDFLPALQKYGLKTKKKKFGANFKLNEIDEIPIHSILGRYNLQLM